MAANNHLEERVHIITSEEIECLVGMQLENAQNHGRPYTVAPGMGGGYRFNYHASASGNLKICVRVVIEGQLVVVPVLTTRKKVDFGGGEQGVANLAAFYG